MSRELPSTTWQYWTGKPPSAAVQLCIESVRRHNRDARLVSDDIIRDMPAGGDELPSGEELLAALSGRPSYEKADVIRLWLLAMFGGQWIDTDCVALRRLDWQDLCDRFELVCFGYATGSPWVSNAVLAAPAGSPLVTQAFHAALRLIRRGGKLYYGATGQSLLRAAIEGSRDSRVRRFEHWRIMPIRWRDADRFWNYGEDNAFFRGRDWNATAYLYHLTNRALNPYAGWDRDRLLTAKRFLPFLFRQSQFPGRSMEILERVPADRPTSGVEVGVFFGANAQVLLQERPGLTLTLVDMWQHRPTPWYRQYDWTKVLDTATEKVRFAGPRANICRGESVRVARTIAPESQDFVFVDAGHDYASVTADIAAWLPAVKRGGWIGGHDYCPRFPGVVQAVVELVDRLKVRADFGEDDTWFLQV